MLIYNVTLKVHPGIIAEWKTWMSQIHIPEMMATGLFAQCSFCRLLDQDESDGTTFVAQYYCNNRDNYERYLQEHAPEMRQKGFDKFGDKVLGFRTLMEIIAEPGKKN
ncbi:MAG TPA: DUF4286 family protein [Edaphocola sp.]|nr:DUF4286 family protein [Edaphocola sp.]